MAQDRFITLDIDFSAIDKLAKGIKEARQILAQEFTRAMRQTIFAIERVAKRRAPVDTGRLRASITPDIRSPFEGHVGTNVAYAAAVEHGGRPHTIKPRKAKVLRFAIGGSKGRYVTSKSGKKYWRKGKKGQEVFVMSVRHPGTKAKPFLEPAYRKGITAADKEYKQALTRILTRLKKAA